MSSAIALNTFHHDKIALKHMGRIVIIAKRKIFALLESNPNCHTHTLLSSSEMSMRMKLTRVLQGHGNFQKLQRWWVQAHHMLRSTRQDKIVDDIAKGGSLSPYAVMEIEEVPQTAAAGTLPTIKAVSIGSTTGDIGSLGINEKFTLVLHKSLDYMTGEFKTEFAKLLDPLAIGVTVAALGIIVFGGPVLSSIVVTIGFAFAGWAILKAIGNIIDFVVLTKNAKVDQDINQAAQRLATAAAQVGVGALIGILTRGAQKIGVGRRRRLRERQESQEEVVESNSKGQKPRVKTERVHLDDNVTWNPKSYSNLDENGLPEFDNKNTFGKLEVNGQQYNLKNGKGQPGLSLLEDPNVKAGAISHSHAEGHAAAILRQTGAKEGAIIINNPNGPCGYCDKVLENMLPQGSKLKVDWPGGSRVFTGNAK